MRTLIFSACIFFLSAITASSQFTAIMHNVVSGSDRVYTVYSDGDNYRYEFEEDGEKGVVIVYPGKNETHILFPGQKLIHKTSCDGIMSRMNDPVQACYAFEKGGEEKTVGEEIVDGRKTTIKELYRNDDRVYTMWFSEELNFPVKIVFHPGDETYMLLEDIKLWEADESYFNTPADYVEVDSRMRPLIPEPQDPEQWTLKEASVPYKDDISRGERISISIDKPVYHRFIIKNNSDKPSKIVRHTIRDGEELPDSEQGPADYRTYRLHGGESKTLTFDWKAGDIILLEAFEGTMHVEIYPE